MSYQDEIDKHLLQADRWLAVLDLPADTGLVSSRDAANIAIAHLLAVIVKANWGRSSAPKETQG